MSLLATFFGVLISIYCFTALAVRVNLIDMPNDRKLHESGVPLVGGIAIYAVMLASTIFFDIPKAFTWVTFFAGALVILGVIDDAFDVSVPFKLVGQTILAWLVIIFSDLMLISAGLDVFELDSSLIWLSYLATIFAVVGLTNAFNMSDGIDGLSSGHFLIGIGTLLVTIACAHGELSITSWLEVVFISVLAFFLVNIGLTPLRIVFLGDAGSLLLGFLMGWILIYVSQPPRNLINPVAGLWCVSIPIFDTLAVMAIRVIQRRSVFSPDRCHLHHFLVDAGLHPKLVLMVILTLACVMNCLGVWLAFHVSTWVSLAIFVVLLLVFCLSLIDGTTFNSLARRLILRLK